MTVSFKFISKNAKLPEIKTTGAAGADLYACIDSNIIIQPGETKFIPLGFKTEFEPGYVGLIYARSGLACKHGLAPANKVGVIDSDYRGEWMVALHNHSDRTEQVAPGDRIAQVIFQKVELPNFVVVDDLSDTERGEGGFNSTGKQ